MVKKVMEIQQENEAVLNLFDCDFKSSSKTHARTRKSYQQYTCKSKRHDIEESSDWNWFVTKKNNLHLNVEMSGSSQLTSNCLREISTSVESAGSSSAVKSNQQSMAIKINH